MATSILSAESDVGESIPAMTPHAVSVSLPTWRANVGYEEGEEWVVSKMKTGYPRFFIHKIVQAFSSAILDKFGTPGEKNILFPSRCVALRCVDFFHKHVPGLVNSRIRVLDFVLDTEKGNADMQYVFPQLTAVLFPAEYWGTAKTFWQHSGEGVSSRRAEFCFEMFKKGSLVAGRHLADSGHRLCKGPRRYRKSANNDQRPDETSDGKYGTQFIEERFGRNLGFKMASNAKVAIKRRIAGSLTVDVTLEEALQISMEKPVLRTVPGFSDDDIYLYPSGMSAIFNTHRLFLAAKGALKSISYGFPYIDTLKILEKFGPGCLFYGHGSSEDLDDLEQKLENGERYLALFCEFPGNPLLKSPDLARIRQLADRYGFGVVIDETIGNFLNVNVLPYADVVVSSLTKVFSGDSNVMGGSAILNPKGQFYDQLKAEWSDGYEDNYWAEDAIFMERNSRDFAHRIDRINVNAEAICDVLMSDPRVKQVNYPKHSPTKMFYDRCRNPGGGYGGLLSATFFCSEDAIAFFDNLSTAKGPSLGTNFTLSSPYVLLAHYQELDWAESFGVERDLIRFSVGLEDTEKLGAAFRQALDAIPKR